MSSKLLSENPPRTSNVENESLEDQDIIRFPRYSMPDGLIESITRYDGSDKAVILKCKERFFGRKDGLIEIITSSRGDIMRFNPAKSLGLLGVVFAVNGWELYWKFRPDGLFKATQSQERFATYFAGREDKVIERRGVATNPNDGTPNLLVSLSSVHFSDSKVESKPDDTMYERYHASEHTDHLVMCIDILSRMRIILTGRLTDAFPSWEMTVHDRSRLGAPWTASAEE